MHPTLHAYEGYVEFSVASQGSAGAIPIQVVNNLLNVEESFIRTYLGPFVVYEYFIVSYVCVVWTYNKIYR